MVTSNLSHKSTMNQQKKALRHLLGLYCRARSGAEQMYTIGRNYVLQLDTVNLDTSAHVETLVCNTPKTYEWHDIQFFIYA